MGKATIVYISDVLVDDYYLEVGGPALLLSHVKNDKMGIVKRAFKSPFYYT